MAIDPWLIEQLKREEKEKDLYERPVLRLPLYEYGEPGEAYKPPEEEEASSRVIIIDYGTEDEEE